MIGIILLVLAAGAAIVDFYMRRVWLAIAVLFLAIGIAAGAIEGMQNLQ
jgi:hypothetical protein